MPAKEKAFFLPPRDLFDVVSLNDITHLAVVLGYADRLTPRGVPGSDDAAAAPDDAAVATPRRNEGDDETAAANSEVPPGMLSPRSAAAEKERVLEYRDSNGYSALHIACVHGHDTIARMLVSCGADVSAETAFGYTPMHAAAEHGHLALVEMLLEAGASASPVSRKFETPVELSRRNKHGRVTVVLEPRTKSAFSADSDPLTAAVSGDLLFFAMSVAEGKTVPISVAATDGGENCLMSICKLDNIDKTAHINVMRILLEKGLNHVNVSSKAKLTALMYAAKNNHLEAAKLLLENGADPSLTFDEEGNQTAVDLATNLELKMTLEVALMQHRYDTLYAARNEVCYYDRPQAAASIRTARTKLEEATANLAELLAPPPPAVEEEEEGELPASQ